MRGLVVYSFVRDGIEVDGADDVQVHCNFVGTDPSGTLDRPNLNSGVFLGSSINSVVGGDGPPPRRSPSLALAALRRSG